MLVLRSFVREPSQLEIGRLGRGDIRFSSTLVFESFFLMALAEKA